MALTQHTPRVYEVIGIKQDYPQAASSLIYEGAAAGNSSGYARALVASDVFLGFVRVGSDNSSGAAGDADVEIIPEGRIHLPIVDALTVAICHALPAVYASDDGTFTTTSTGNSKIGYISRYISTNEAEVTFFQTQN